MVDGFQLLKFHNTMACIPAHDKTYKKTCLTSKNSNQPVNPPCMAKVHVYPTLDSPEAVDDTCDQRRLRSDFADAQSDLSLR